MGRTRCSIFCNTIYRNHREICFRVRFVCFHSKEISSHNKKFPFQWGFEGFWAHLHANKVASRRRVFQVARCQPMVSLCCSCFVRRLPSRRIVTSQDPIVISQDANGLHSLSGPEQCSNFGPLSEEICANLKRNTVA